jgi:hypothetical protein
MMSDTLSSIPWSRPKRPFARKWGTPRILFSLWLLGTPVYVVHVSHALQHDPAFWDGPIQQSSGPIGPEGGVTEIRKTRAPAVSDRSRTQTPLALGDDPIVSFQTSGVKDEDEAAGWVEVVRAARVHTAPSVSSPTVLFYPVGEKLQFIGHEDGWFEVRDSAGVKRGWIYEQYLEAIPDPGHQVAVAQNGPAKPTLKVQASAQPRLKAKANRLAKAEKTQRQPLRFAQPSPYREAWAQPTESAEPRRTVHTEGPRWMSFLIP